MKNDEMLLCTRTSPVFYIHEIRGAVYVSWVSDKDKKEAVGFPANKIVKWREVLSEMTGFDLKIAS